MKKLVSLFIAARLYILITPVALFLAGAGLNQAVLIANGGKFPVMQNVRAACHGIDADGFMDDVHCLMTRDTKLNWLADFIALGNSVMSPGDLLIYLGDWLRTYSSAVWTVLIVGDVARLTSRLRTPVLNYRPHGSNPRCGSESATGPSRVYR